MLTYDELIKSGAIRCEMMPRLPDGRGPVVTNDQWLPTMRNEAGHPGNDVMYPRAAEPADGVVANRKFACPPRVPILSPCHAFVQGVSERANGWHAWINVFTGPADAAGTHATGWRIGAWHMRRLHVARGDILTPGQPIGIVGDPRPGLIHLHREVHRWNRDDTHLYDVEPLFEGAAPVPWQGEWGDPYEEPIPTPDLPLMPGAISRERVLEIVDEAFAELRARIAAG